MNCPCDLLRLFVAKEMAAKKHQKARKGFPSVFWLPTNPDEKYEGAMR
jgi:hypothetical protein